MKNGKKRNWVAFLVFIAVLFLIIFKSVVSYASFFGPKDMGSGMWNSDMTKLDDCTVDERFDPGSKFNQLIEVQNLFNNKEYQLALINLDEIIELYSAKAKEMQDSLDERPWESKAKVFRYKELNAVGAALLIKGLIFYQMGEYESAEKTLQVILNNYSYALFWNDMGWFADIDRLSHELLAQIYINETKYRNKSLFDIGKQLAGQVYIDKKSRFMVACPISDSVIKSDSKGIYYNYLDEMITNGVSVYLTKENSNGDINLNKALGDIKKMFIDKKQNIDIIREESSNYKDYKAIDFNFIIPSSESDLSRIYISRLVETKNFIYWIYYSDKNLFDKNPEIQKYQYIDANNFFKRIYFENEFDAPSRFDRFFRI